MDFNIQYYYNLLQNQLLPTGDNSQNPKHYMYPPFPIKSKHVL